MESELDDFQTIHNNIVQESVFKGTNLWILMFAIVVASVGLNVNSTAVIIGAMLISPLMGPINGMGYSIAVQDYDLFRRTLKNFSFAVLVSLVASTTYFAISPISVAASELLARTTPTIYDVIIALFGGMAGIIGIANKKKGNVIPGVAIATALMPPLCTAGYGLATAQYEFFFGALFLFTINTVFIALSSVIVSQIMKFPIYNPIDEARKKRANQLVSLVTIIVLLPSIYFGYQLVQKERFEQNAQRLISNVSLYDGNYLLNSKIDYKEGIITLVYGGIDMTDEQKSEIAEKRNDFNLTNAKIVVNQGLALNSISKSTTEREQYQIEIDNLNKLLQEKELQLITQANSDSLGRVILAEAKTLFPQISECSFAQSLTFNNNKTDASKTDIILFGIEGKALNNSQKVTIKKWLTTRLSSRDLKVIFE